jgi:hypothetical protein
LDFSGKHLKEYDLDYIKHSIKRIPKCAVIILNLNWLSIPRG